MPFTRQSLFVVFSLLFLVACQSDPDSSQQAPPSSTPSQAESTSEETTKANEPTVTAKTKKNGFSLFVADQSVTTGSEICLDVKTQDFQKILSMQYTMNWNPNVLKFKEFGELNLKDLNASNFNTQIAAKGSMPLSWFDQDIKGLTMKDGSSIYQLCYEVIGAAGSSSRFIFTNDPVTIEISNAGGQILPLIKNRATIGLNKSIKVRYRPLKRKICGKAFFYPLQSYFVPDLPVVSNLVIDKPFHLHSFHLPN